MIFHEIKTYFQTGYYIEVHHDSESIDAIRFFIKDPEGLIVFEHDIDENEVQSLIALLTNVLRTS